MSRIYINKQDRQKFIDFFEKMVYPAIKRQDLDYYKIVDGISNHLNLQRELVQELIEEFYFKTKKVQDHRVMSIPEEQLGEFLDYLKERENRNNQTKKDLEMLGLEERKA